MISGKVKRSKNKQQAKQTIKKKFSSKDSAALVDQWLDDAALYPRQIVQWIDDIIRCCDVINKSRQSQTDTMAIFFIRLYGALTEIADCNIPKLRSIIDQYIPNLIKSFSNDEKYI